MVNYGPISKGLLLIAEIFLGLIKIIVVNYILVLFYYVENILLKINNIIINFELINGKNITVYLQINSK